MASPASELSNIKSGWPAATLSPTVTKILEMRPGTGKRTRETRVGLASIFPGAVTSSVGSSAVSTVPTRIWASLGESGAMTTSPVDEAVVAPVEGCVGFFSSRPSIAS